MNSEEPSTKSTTDFFLDTYAIVEIARKNPNYEKFLNKPFVITKLNLFEFHQYLVRAKGEVYADELIESYLPNVMEYDVEIIKKASKFRAENTSKNFSMTDCIGYVYAKENGLMFVTGDREFKGKGFENVEFVQ